MTPIDSFAAVYQNDDTLSGFSEGPVNPRGVWCDGKACFGASGHGVVAAAPQGAFNVGRGGQEYAPCAALGSRYQVHVNYMHSAVAARY